MTDGCWHSGRDLVDATDWPGGSPVTPGANLGLALSLRPTEIPPLCRSSVPRVIGRCSPCFCVKRRSVQLSQLTLPHFTSSQQAYILEYCICNLACIAQHGVCLSAVTREVGRSPRRLPTLASGSHAAIAHVDTQPKGALPGGGARAASFAAKAAAYASGRDNALNATEFAVELHLTSQEPCFARWHGRGRDSCAYCHVAST